MLRDVRARTLKEPKWEQIAQSGHTANAQHWINGYPVGQLHEGLAVLLVVLPVLLLVVPGAVEDVLAAGAEGLGQVAADHAVALRQAFLSALLDICRLLRHCIMAQWH